MILRLPVKLDAIIIYKFNIFRLKKMEADIDGEERARGQLTGELRIKKTQHMTTSRWRSQKYFISET